MSKLRLSHLSDEIGAKPWGQKKIARLSGRFRGPDGRGRPIRPSTGLATGGITCTGIFYVE
jgi:hypothetical protein